MPRATLVLMCAFMVFATLTGCGSSDSIAVPAESSEPVAQPDLDDDAIADPDNQAARTDNAAGAAASQPLNVIWILCDALRAENLECYGYDRPTTPNLKQLAARGVLFEEQFSQANGTALSVPSYMSGRYFPVLCLSSGNWRQLYRTPSSGEMLLPEIMGANGYYTACISTHPWFAPGSRIYDAFDECTFLPSKSGLAYAEFDEVNDAAFTWLEQPRDKPFLLYLHTMDTHFPHYIKEGHDAWIDRDYAAQADESTPYSDAQKAHFRGLYDGSLHFADEQIGRLLARIDELGMRDNTVVLVSSDHGECLGEDAETIDHPGSMTVDQLFHVPFIIAGPGLPEGKRITSITENSDIVPTLVDLLGLDTQAEFDGISLRSVMDGSEELDRPYTAARFPAGEDDFLHWVSVRDKEYRLEYHPVGGNAELWTVPDLLGQRTNAVGDDPGTVAAMAGYVQDRLLPLWGNYVDLPRNSPRVFPLEISPAFAVTDGVHVPEFNMTDNKWGLQYLGLISTASQEDCPPISFRFDVPNGVYRVQLEMLPKDTGSSFLVKAEDSEEFIEVTSEARAKAREFVDLGIIEILDGAFDVTLDEGNHLNSARLTSFRFIPIIEGEEITAGDSQEERNEQLEALGYL